MSHTAVNVSPSLSLLGDCIGTRAAGQPETRDLGREIPHVPPKPRSGGQQLNHRDIFAEGCVVSPRHFGVSLNSKQLICNVSERNVIQE